MLNITEQRVLLSMRREADRQSAFYLRQGECGLADSWADFARLCDLAVQRRGSLLIENRDVYHSPIPIKACEQGQQPPNHNVIKALQ